ncbi:MAG: hypothetical protein JW982_15290 [Spirochaetes bacterium]|nr:hypothetical protein [Spirochaetota bacterium]
MENSIRNSTDLTEEQRLAASASMKESLKWQEYHYFVFTINHATAWGFNKDDFVFSITGSDGKPIKASATSLNYVITGDDTFYVHRWIIKTEIPVIKANVASPETVKFQLFKSYTLS